LETGASAVPVLARLRIIFGSAGIGIGGVLPIGTALVTEFAPRRIRATMIVMAVVGVALGAAWPGLVAAQFMSIYGSRARDRPARAAGAPCGPNRSPRVMSPDSKPALSAPPESTNESEARTGTADAPVSKESPPCFLSVICFWRK
jgi:MFS family permease